MPDHPVYVVSASPRRIERLKARVEPLMRMSEEYMVALLPGRTGLRFMGRMRVYIAKDRFNSNVDSQRLRSNQ